jgi:DNA repair protein RadC
MDIVQEERADVRAESKGFESLTTVELISLILGGSSSTLMDQSRQILKLVDCKLPKLRNVSEKELTAINGVGSCKAKALLAALELGKRVSCSKHETDSIDSSSAVYNYLHPRMQFLDTEEFWILLMNNSFKLLKAERIGQGGLTDTAADIRIMMREAVLNNATVMAVAHNHPSGTLRPSSQDDRLTDRIKKACEIMRVHFLDHVIVTDGGYYSYRDEDRL